MITSILCRLAYLVTPKPELMEALGVSEEDFREICSPVTVITPLRDYENTFEAWKRTWAAKAKEDFVAEFVHLWSDAFPEFTSQLQPRESFDQWWSLSEIDVIEIDPAWKPS
ncbi:hypothetical protein ACXR0O_23505 [Verrucomicrobiota bacterium sgz303538]